MTGNERWENNWRAVAPAGAVRADVRRAPAGRGALRRRIRELPPGTPVVLCGSAPLAARRCRAFAARAGVELEREYLAFPSARAPGYLVEDAAVTVRMFVRSILVAPPSPTGATPVALAMSLLRKLSPWRAIAAIAPGRVLVGRRA